MIFADQMLLHVVQSECIAKYGARSKKCTYTIDYPGTIPGAR